MQHKCRIPKVAIVELIINTLNTIQWYNMNDQIEILSVIYVDYDWRYEFKQLFLGIYNLLSL